MGQVPTEAQMTDSLLPTWATTFHLLLSLVLSARRAVLE